RPWPKLLHLSRAHATLRRWTPNSTLRCPGLLKKARTAFGDQKWKRTFAQTRTSSRFGSNGLDTHMTTNHLDRRLDGLGTVRGVALGQILAFRGVPYAAPPLGPLRFTPPHPPIPWHGV